MARLTICSLMVFAVAGCGGTSSGSSGGGGATGGAASSTPVISTAAAQGGAEIVTLSDAVAGATIFYTLDGSTPTAASTQYLAPILVASKVTLRAMAEVNGTASTLVSEAFTPNIASGTLIWSDEFSNSTNAAAEPNPAVWTYDSGAGGFGNNELETYCPWGSNALPCSSANPNVYVGTDGYLHIVAEQPSGGVYTSARLRTQGLMSLSYGRVEARMQLPEGQGLWPAFWLMGNNYATVGWPVCGEMDIMEHINSPSTDYVMGSVHITNGNSTHDYSSSGFSAGGWHVYGMIWTPGSVEYYVDSPTNVYAHYTPSLMNGATWPFDTGNNAFLLLNLSVGGNLPGSPNSSTVFPAQMLVDYVRIYTN